MNKISLIAVGLLRSKALKALEQDYVSRLKYYTDLSIIEIKESALADTDPAKYHRETARLIQAKVAPTDYVLVLDPKGKAFSSETLSAHLSSLPLNGKRLVFLIGGSIGLSDALRSQAHGTISFSSLTFPHMLFRIIFLEQLYRVFTILKKEKYHK